MPNRKLNKDPKATSFIVIRQKPEKRNELLFKIIPKYSECQDKTRILSLNFTYYKVTASLKIARYDMRIGTTQIFWRWQLRVRGKDS